MRFKTVGLMCALALSAGAMTGCASKTEGEQTLDKAAKIQDAGNRITRGEQMVRDGEGMIAKGKTAKMQGDQTGGDKMISDGESMRSQGQVLIEQGRKDKM